MKIAFLDVETTGTSASRGGIIEVGLILTEDLHEIETYSTLVRPMFPVPPYIQMLTGIADNELESAPSFYDISLKLYSYLEGSLLVAHNVNFDYSFLHEEFNRIGYDYAPERLCSIRMFKHLYPGRRSGSLDSLINTFGLKVENRHRALDDAKAIYDFFKISAKQHGESHVNKTIELLTKKTNLPQFLDRKKVKDYPEGPGVYIFYSKDGAPLYVGKAVNIRKRLMSHFTTSALDTDKIKLIENTTYIEIIETAGELGALLKEARLIKELKPLHNKVLRNSGSIAYVSAIKNSKHYLTAKINKIENPGYDDLKNSIGIYKNVHSAKLALTKIAGENSLCYGLLGLETLSKNAPCFRYRLGRCAGACCGKEPNVEHNERFERAFKDQKLRKWPHSRPFTLTERHPTDEDKTETHIIDKWCYIGTQNEHYENQSPKFDLDLYRILRKWV